MIDIVNADRSQIRFVLDNVRMVDALEIAAAGIDVLHMPDVLMRHKVFCYAACHEECGPVAIWGMINRRQGVGAGFAFGTDEWPRAVIPMVRQIRHFVIPFLIDTGYHRVEAAALAGRDDVASLMHLIGAKPEGRLRGYGTSGEDFISYRWLHGRRRDRETARAQDQHVTH
jgi:hypothetical protein